MTSPKKPLQVPVFMEVFNKARLIKEIPDEDDLDILNSDDLSYDEPSSNIQVKKAAPAEDPYDANAHTNYGPGIAPAVIADKAPADESDEYEETETTTQSKNANSENVKA